MNTTDRRTATRPPKRAAWRDRLYVIIFEADTPAGQWFDVGLLVAILLSIVIVSLETVPYFQNTSPWPHVLYGGEWALTILFSIEYVGRLVSSRRPWHYAHSFFGIIDLLACLPMYLTLLDVNSKSLMILRSIRLLRVFRVLKLMRMLREAHALREAVWRARDRILVFVAVVLVAVTISATLMYQIEHGLNPRFSSIPMAMYWAIVSLTTVGYGDITPMTAVGKFISAMLILLGYSLIIVPTGFVSAEIQSLRRAHDLNSRTCPRCFRAGHAREANYCDICGEPLVHPDTNQGSAPLPSPDSSGT
ncbi:MAG: potassium channel protein [Pirellulaceae bacterium]|nr:MAG: potassium channel protein [Pirellulaceae bacterium]